MSSGRSPPGVGGCWELRWESLVCDLYGRHKLASHFPGVCEARRPGGAGSRTWWAVQPWAGGTATGRLRETAVESRALKEGTPFQPGAPLRLGGASPGVPKAGRGRAGARLLAPPGVQRGGPMQPALARALSEGVLLGSSPLSWNAGESQLWIAPSVETGRGVGTPSREPGLSGPDNRA